MLTAVFGGALIGLAAAGLLLGTGRIAGVSGIAGGLVVPRGARGGWAWRACFVAGLIAGGLVMVRVVPGSFGTLPRSLPALLASGILVGVGTRIGNGCTSGHGVCGAGRGSPRSLAATATFMLTGAATAFVVNHVLGGVL
jgi:uncharacterized membrane protein YedE/YeeE